MTAAPPAATSGGGGHAAHLVRIGAIWAVLTGVLDPVYYLLIGPHIPPGVMTSSAGNDQLDFNVLVLAGLPVVLAIVVYLVYAVTVWRTPAGSVPAGDPQDPAALATPELAIPARRSRRVQAIWIGVSTALVLGTVIFGTAELVTSSAAGAGGAEGALPAWTPSSSHPLVVQVIAQQWKFSYRYPTYGGFETDSLVLPDQATIAFHVTSLDVIHGFWAYQLGVKADANPGLDNVAFTTTKQKGSFIVRCDELCGLWHGAMYDYGKVVSPTAFQHWATSTEATQAGATRLLPAFAWTYIPDANGADGGFYPDNQDPYSNQDLYGHGGK